MLRIKWLLWSAVQAGLAVYGLSLIGYLLARLLAGEAWPWVMWAGNFIPWWALGGLLAAGIALFSRRRVLLIGLQLPILIVFAANYGDLLVPNEVADGQAHSAANTITLRAATFNIRASVSDPHRVVDAITALEADIIGLQELSTRHAAVIFVALATEYPYHYHFYDPGPVGHEMNVGILSRYPILSTDPYTQRTHGRNLRVQDDEQGNTISVYLEHPNSPENPFSLLAYDPTLHDLKVRNLADALESDPNPVIVLCDCNMTDQTPSYRRLRDRLTDAFREAGWGLGFTFPAHPLFGGLVTVPVLRIDYIWHSDHFVAADAYVAEDSGTSDHFPVVATLRLYKDRTTR